MFVYQSRLSLAKVSLEPGDASIHRRTCSEMEEGVKLAFCKSIKGYLSWKMAPYLSEDVRLIRGVYGTTQGSDQSLFSEVRPRTRPCGRGGHFADTVQK